MKGWKECKLKDILKINYGKSLTENRRKHGDIPVFGSSGIVGWHINSLVNKKGIIIGRKGTVGAIHYSDKPFYPIDTTYYFTEKDTKEDLKFMYYLMEFIPLNRFDESSAVPGLNRNTFYNLDIIIPTDIKEQKAIAGILSAFDDKIELLRKQNETLENIADILFRQCFMKKAKKSWKEKKLGDFVTVKRGGSPRPIRKYLSDTGLRWLKISDATNEISPYIFEIKEHIKKEGLNKTIFLNVGSLVLSNSATPGIPKILQVDSCIHDGWLYFPESLFSNEFLYLLFKKIKPQLLQQGSGSVFTNLKTDILKNFKIRVPDENSLNKFQNQVGLYFKKILSNSKQIKSLETFRDTLLPKLMSGEIRVKY